MKKRLLAVVLLLGSMVSGWVFAHGKHVHGETEMEVVMDGNELEIDISGPLTNFLGFEHAPKDNRQKKALVDMTDDLREGDRLFEINPEAVCSFASSKVLVKKGDRTAHPTMLHTLGAKKKDGHADIDATYAFSCKNPAEFKSIKIKFFGRFPGLTKLDVRVVLPKKQMAAELTPQNPLLSW
jgi:hypothetical protein